MNKLYLSVLLLGLVGLMSGQQTYTFSPVFIGIGPPSAPDVPVPCPAGAQYFDAISSNSTGPWFCNGTPGATPPNGTWVQAVQAATGVGVATTVPYSTTPTFDASQGTVFNITLTGDVTAPTFVNAVSGQRYAFAITQDATGGHAWSWFGGAVGQLTGFSILPNATTIADGIFLNGNFYIQSYTKIATPGNVSLTVTLAGAGTGSVVSTPNGINCPGTCVASFPIGTVIQLVATPASGSTFTSASGAGCTTQTCNITLTTDSTVTETFGGSSTVFSVTMNETGSGGGNVTSSPAGINCGNGGTACSANFASGTAITLTQTPNATSQFGSWTGCDTFTGTTCTIASIGANKTIGASFVTVGAINFVQSAQSGTVVSSHVSVAYPNAQNAGDFNVVVIGWNDKTQTVSTVTDSAGNSYHLACQSLQHPSATLTQAIWFATNVAAGSNTVTVTWGAAPTTPDIRILEYSGVSSAIATDGTCQTATGASPNSASLATTFSNDLVIIGNTTSGGISGVSSGFVQRMFVTATDDDVEDKIGAAAGTINMAVTFTGSNISQMVAFQGQSGSSSSCTPAYGKFAAGTQPPACYQPFAATSPFNSAVPATASSACPSGASGAHPCYSTNSSTYVNTALTIGGSTLFNFTYPNPASGGDSWHPIYYCGGTSGVSCGGWFKISSGGTFCNGNNQVLQIPSFVQGGSGTDQHASLINQTTNIELACDGFPKGGPGAGGASSGSPVTLSATCGTGDVTSSIGASPGTTGFCATTASFADSALIFRYPELSSGQINHAIFVLERNCGGSVGEVYPGQTGGNGATGGCSQGAQAPVGSLIWYDVPCSTIKTFGLSLVQQTILCALNQYGGYIGDTGGPSTTEGWALLGESGKTYTTNGLSDPMGTFLNGHGCTANACSFSGVPAGGAFSSHLHVLDPCVAKQMAGASGGCSP